MNGGTLITKRWVAGSLVSQGLQPSGDRESQSGGPWALDRETSHALSLLRPAFHGYPRLSGRYPTGGLIIPQFLCNRGAVTLLGVGDAICAFDG